MSTCVPNMGGSASKKKSTEKKDGEKEKNLSPPAAAAASVSDTAADSSATKEAETTPDTSDAKEKDSLADTSPEKKTKNTPDTSATKETSSDISAAEKIESLDTDTIWIKIADHAGENKVIELSPFDRNAAGRAVPMLWYYKDKLDQDVLLSSLRKALSAYPGWWKNTCCYCCGSYSLPGY